LLDSIVGSEEGPRYQLERLRLPLRSQRLCRSPSWRRSHESTCLAAPPGTRRARSWLRARRPGERRPRRRPLDDAQQGDESPSAVKFGQVLHVQAHAAVSGTASELLRRQESVLGEGKREAE
jgi:hypothetical protein